MRAGKRKNHGQTQARMALPDRARAGVAATMPAPLVGIEPDIATQAPAAALSRAQPLGLCPPPLEVPQATRPLDDEWARWILENSLRRVAPESMMATVMQAGIDTAQANGFMLALPGNPMYQAAEKMRDRHDRFARVMHNVQAVAESAPDYTHVEKRSRVSREEFIQRYVRGGRPVVLTDMARDWPALQRWSFDEFRRRCGSLADESLTANDESLRRPEFRGLLDEVGPLPDFCDPSMLERGASLWIAPAGTRTALRHDTRMLLHTQIVGRKRWRLVSPLSGPNLYSDVDGHSPLDFEAPDLQRFPDAATVKVLDVVVEPGETIFLPLGWWHQETSLDQCISLSFANFSFPNTFDFSPAAEMK